MNLTTPIGSLGSHNAVGIGSAAIVAPLTVVLQHFQVLDSGTAAAEALLIAVLLHVIGSIIAMLLPPHPAPDAGDRVQVVPTSWHALTPLEPTGSVPQASPAPPGAAP